ncbi:MAG: hypothetical protein GTO05_13680, partial [Gemmatimonadales bacterium]|nr:hypothetical protein [Gemmatimonadales bacterium]
MRHPGEQTATDPDWIHQAACRSLPTSVFFPAPGEDRAVSLAKAICVGCLVKGACLEFGLHQPDGIWGGTTPGERRRIRR